LTRKEDISTTEAGPSNAEDGSSGSDDELLLSDLDMTSDEIDEFIGPDLDFLYAEGESPSSEEQLAEEKELADDEEGELADEEESSIPDEEETSILDEEAPDEPKPRKKNFPKSSIAGEVVRKRVLTDLHQKRLVTMWTDGRRDILKAGFRREFNLELHWSEGHDSGGS